ncbi:MAG: hypothetical protein JRJ14_09520 [Deltaproteobacteria bacterium]|nr:hypothetical protein [Deltaproteobacteria bacterium]
MLCSIGGEHIPNPPETLEVGYGREEELGGNGYALPNERFFKTAERPLFHAAYGCHETK